MKVAFDTNVLIDSLKGVGEAVRQVNLHPRAFISVVTWIEVMAGADKDGIADIVREFLAPFECVHLDREIAERAALLRRGTKLKLADAVVLATAQARDAVLVTRDNDFSGQGAIRNPYKM